MAAFARGAPLPESSAQVADQQFQGVVQRSRSLTQKILLSIPDAHESCVHAEVTRPFDEPNQRAERDGEVLRA